MIMKNLRVMMGVLQPKTFFNNYQLNRLMKMIRSKSKFLQMMSLKVENLMSLKVENLMSLKVENLMNLKEENLMSLKVENLVTAP